MYNEKTIKNWFIGPLIAIIIFLFGVIKARMCNGGFECIAYVVPIILGFILFFVSLIYSFFNIKLLKRDIKYAELIIMILLSGIILFGLI